MTKQEYLLSLQNALRGNITKREIQNIIADYAEYFDSGIAEGKSESGLCEEFGDPAALGKEIAHSAAKPIDIRQGIVHSGLVLIAKLLCSAAALFLCLYLNIFAQAAGIPLLLFAIITLSRLTYVQRVKGEGSAESSAKQLRSTIESSDDFANRQHRRTSGSFDDFANRQHHRTSGSFDDFTNQQHHRTSGSFDNFANRQHHRASGSSEDFTNQRQRRTSASSDDFPDQLQHHTSGNSNTIADIIIAIIFVAFHLLPLWGIVYTVAIIPPLLLMALFIAKKPNLSFWLSFAPVISIIAGIIYLSAFADESYSGIWMIIAYSIPYALAIPTQLIIRNQVLQPFSLWFAAIPVTLGISLMLQSAKHYLFILGEEDISYITQTASALYLDAVHMLVISAAMGVLVLVALVFLNKREYSYDRCTV